MPCFGTQSQTDDLWYFSKVVLPVMKNRVSKSVFENNIFIKKYISKNIISFPWCRLVIGYSQFRTTRGLSRWNNLLGQLWKLYFRCSNATKHNSLPFLGISNFLKKGRANIFRNDNHFKCNIMPCGQRRLLRLET